MKCFLSLMLTRCSLTKPRVCYFLLLLLIICDIQSQIFSINGKITADSIPVSCASVTFIDEVDPSNTYTALTDTAGNYQISIVTGIKEDLTIPKTIELAQNYPNPFTSETQISYKLKNQSDVSIKIYDILGREVRTFRIGLKSNGIHGIKWDGRNNINNKVAPGIYLYRLQAGNETQVKKMIFARGNAIPYVPLFSNNSFNTERIEKTKSTLQIKTYTCIIENASNTNPKILTKETKGIKIDRDSTLNFTVTRKSDSYLPLNIGNEWTYQLIYDSPFVGPEIRTVDYQIITTKSVNGETYYGFNRTFIVNGETYYGFIQTFPFSPEAFLVEDYDSVFVRQNEKGDIIFLIDDFEYPYFTFDPLLLGLTNRKKVKDTRYCYRIESINDTIVTPIGSFNKCFKIFSSSADFVDTEYYTWFAAGYGPVKIYYPEGGVTYELIKINIQK